MTEIIPVTKDQLFEMKIAENTGSDYNVGDISNVVPVTKDQALLKEIALNSAGQSGDISELEGKVADNTAAIEAIVNEYGAKNELPNNAVSDTVSGVTFTVNADKTITANGTATDDITFMLYDGVSLKLKDHLYSGCPLQTGVAIGAKFTTEGYRVVTTGATPEVALIDDIDKIYISIVNGTVVNNLVFKPMIRDARIKDPTYVPHAMTNEQLTDAVNRGSVSVTSDGVKTFTQLLNDLFSLIDLTRVSYKSCLVIYTDILSITEKENAALGFGMSRLSEYGKKVDDIVYLHATNSMIYEYVDGTKTDMSANVLSPNVRMSFYY